MGEWGAGIRFRWGGACRVAEQCHLDVGQCACCAGPIEINTNVVVVCLLGHSLAFDVKPLVTCVAANCGLFVSHIPTARSTRVLGDMGSRVDFYVKHK